MLTSRGSSKRCITGTQLKRHIILKFILILHIIVNRIIIATNHLLNRLIINQSNKIFLHTPNLNCIKHKRIGAIYTLFSCIIKVGTVTTTIIAGHSIGCVWSRTWTDLGETRVLIRDLLLCQFKG